MIPAAPAPGPAPATSTVSSTVRPALSQVAQTLDGINVKRWKAPNPVRDAVDGDVSSIQRDLSGTLAGLLQQADAAPTSVPAAFSVYRNVDALYDTLLRVVETAELAAPENEEAQLETALKTLETARTSLGDAILSGSEREQAEVIQLRTAAATVVEHRQEQVRTTVVDDGPAPAHTVHHKHTTTTAKKPEPKTTQSTSNSSNPQ
ncbi:MAG: hypothetical protein WA294_02120 [Acidobacteriaceae bacterium]